LHDLQWSVEDSVGTILLDPPGARNAFTFETIREWAALLRRAKTGGDVRVIVLTGAGDKASCSRLYLSSIVDADPTWRRCNARHNCATKSTRSCTRLPTWTSR
jgi:enoyl-CoA hydratase/carnithine racemase